MKANQAGIVLVFVLILLLAIGFSLKLSAVARKETQLQQTQKALTNAMETSELLLSREQAFDQIKFLVHHQIRTQDALATLRILQTIRQQKDLWFLLIADQESYALGSARLSPDTNTTAQSARPAQPSTNLLEARKRYVVEFCLPDKSDDRRVQREVVTELKSDRLFRDVDQLPPSLRKTNFFDAKQLPANRYFSLALDLDDKPWQKLVFEIPAATNSPALSKK